MGIWGAPWQEGARTAAAFLLIFCSFSEAAGALTWGGGGEGLRWPWWCRRGSWFSLGSWGSCSRLLPLRVLLLPHALCLSSSLFLLLPVCLSDPCLPLVYVCPLTLSPLSLSPFISVSPCFSLPTSLSHLCLSASLVLPSLSLSVCRLPPPPALLPLLPTRTHPNTALPCFPFLHLLPTSFGRE